MWLSKPLLATAALVASALAQPSTSVPWTDPASGIAFSYYQKDGVAFGLAMPETPTGDFIGYLSSSELAGYAGWSLAGSMAGSLLVCAWADGAGGVVGSLRQATGYSNPAAVRNASMAILAIPSGTAVNATGWAFTFLCRGCVTGAADAFAAADAQTTFGYALSTTALADTASADAALNYHDAGFGEYSHSLAEAKSANYAKWAALATADTAPVSGSASGAAGAGKPAPASNTTGKAKPSPKPTISNATYDYIVAGGGAAGIVVAQRLVESGKAVLLLERGPASFYCTGGDATMPYNATVTQYDVPGMGYFLGAGAPQATQYCSDTAGMAGCLLGGGTAVNAMMFVKPAAHDFENFPPGWQWADVAAAAERLYQRSPGFILRNGTGVDQAAFGVMAKFLASNGFSHVDALANPDAKEAIFSHPPWLIRDGLRSGPVRDYLPLAQAQPNFQLALNTQLVRVVRAKGTATGVEVQLQDGSRQIIRLKPRGGVVLAGGALSTPRMLVNSGIGPKAQVQTVQRGAVAVTLPDEADWIELPVGRFLMDHPIFTVELTAKTGLYIEPKTAFTEPNTTVATNFNTKSTGLLAQPGQRLSFWTTVSGNDSVKHYVQGTVAPKANGTIKVKTYLTHGLTSHGVLEVTASGATALTTSPYLQTASDISAITAWMTQLVAMTRKADSPFEPVATPVAALIAADKIDEGDHWVGSARMGAANDGSSVVDAATLKVWGTDNLYVVDASIHTDLPTGNTQAIVMVVAEHASNIILGGAGSTTTTSSDTGSSTTGSSKAGSSTTSSSGATSSKAGSSKAPSASAAANSDKKKKCNKRRAAPQLRL